MKVKDFDCTKTLLESKLKDLYFNILDSFTEDYKPISTILKDLEFKSILFKYKFSLNKKNKSVNISYCLLSSDNYTNYYDINNLKIEDFLKINNDLLTLLNNLRYKLNDYCRK